LEKRLIAGFLSASLAIFVIHFFLDARRIYRSDLKKTNEKIEILRTKIDSLQNVNEEIKKELEDISYLEISENLSFCNELVPLENPLIKRKLENFIFNATKFRANRWRMEIYLNEAQFYFPYFDEGLAQDSLPTDLKYIAVVESEFDNHARSAAGAVGMWQFIPGTAIKWGLTISYYVDDRKDPDEAFTAARKELKELYGKFSSWFLAAAAYNAGARRVEEAIEENRKQRILAAERGEVLDSTYFGLLLPSETMDYVYAILTVKIIMENYKSYGFREPPYKVKDIEIVEYEIKNSNKKIAEAAADLGMSVSDFRFLNPRFTKKEIPPGFYKMKRLKRK